MKTTIATREETFARIMPVRQHSPNHLWVARIVASWTTGHGVLPDYLGLSPNEFEDMCAYFFPDLLFSSYGYSDRPLIDSNMPELEDLRALLWSGVRNQRKETKWMTQLIITACNGQDHLWQDLGLWERKELTALMEYNFPLLAEKNNQNMRWKKFLYKQMCETEGIYVCRSPSCEVCEEFTECFDTEPDR